MLRWWAPTAAMMLLSFLSYVDRNTLALLAHTILRDTGLSAEQYGWIISAFSVAYLVGNPVWGRALDRFGLPLVAGAAAALWTLASVSHALMSTAVGFALARGALGFGEGATFPAGLRTASQTLRDGERSRGVAVAYSGGSLGAIVTPLLVTPIALRWGWRGAFVATGLLGAAWLVLWAIVARDPRLRPARRVGVPPVPRLTSRRLWGFMAAYALGAMPLGFVLYDAPIDLGRRLGCDQATLGLLLWIPPVGWETGYFFWGFVVDRLARRGGLDRPTFGRLYALLTALSLPFAATGLVASRAGVVALLFLAAFASSGFVIASLAEVTRSHPEDHAAYLAGLGAGSWSGVMAVVMPLFGRLLDRSAFEAAYALATVAPVLALVGWRAAMPASRAVAGVARD